MKFAGFKVSLKPPLSRIISDLLSLGISVFTFVETSLFVERYPELMNSFFRADLIKLWVFPALSLLPIIVYLCLIFSERKFAKYKVTAENVQSVYNWYAFAVSLCKLPLLVLVVDVMLIFQSRLAGNETSWFSIGYLFYAFVFVMIVRVAVHRIKALTKQKTAAENKIIKVKSKTVDKKGK